MKAGLNFLKNNKDSILLDADNLFWAINPGQNESDIFMPASVFSLYEKVKHKLSREIEEFRFGQELTAIYIDPTDKCNASCPYCYIPAKTRQSGRSMTREELGFILNNANAIVQPCPCNPGQPDTAGKAYKPKWSGAGRDIQLYL